MGVRFAILGPVQVIAGDRELTGLAPRHRAVLAYLLLNGRTVLSADQLIDAVWGPAPPDTARAQIQAAVTAIRRVLRQAEGEAGGAGLLATRAGGYVIEPGELDLREFTERMAAAERAADPASAAERIRDALTLWRGRPLADVTADYAESARNRLEERRLSAIERLAEAELALGRHENLIDELSAEVAEHPLRERLSERLMLALHRSARQADALAVARAYREALADQQGLDPGRSFTALEQAILRDDPGLRPQAPADEEPVRPQAAQPPNALPYDIPDFTGRAAELDRVSGERPGVTILAIDGMAGIGKTTLAVHAAHRLAEEYPGGRLFADLRAHTAGQEPVEAAAALETLLRQLGVPAERIPASLGARQELWRSELTGRRVLIVLDNAAGTDQVRPLLPGASDSLVLITSRRRLVDLDGARVLSMDVLPARDGVELFTSIVGERAAAEPGPVLDVLQLCGFLPLAVRIAAARLHHRPRWTVAYLAGRLRDERRRLAELSTPDRGVGAAFALSYEQLEPAQRRMFRLLGLHPGRDCDAHAAAALAGAGPGEAEDLLEELLDAHVLAQYEPGRYTFHDLLREHARGTVQAEESAEARAEAVTRLLDHYRYLAARAIDLLYPYGTRRRPRVPEPEGTGGEPAEVPFLDEPGAAAWLDAERANLVAAGALAARGDWPEHAGQLAGTLHPYLDNHAHRDDAVTLHTAVLESARRRGDEAAEVRVLLDLGWVYHRQGRYAEAYEHTAQALKLSEASGDRFALSRARNTLGNVCLGRGDIEEAHTHLRAALELSRAIGNRVGEAHVLSAIGVGHERQGRYDEAAGYQRQALDLHRELGNRDGEAAVLNHLAGIAHAIGDHGEAGQRYGGALAIAGELGNRTEEARAHLGLGRLNKDLGRTEEAREHATRAHGLYTELGVPEAAEASALVAGLA